MQFFLLIGIATWHFVMNVNSEDVIPTSTKPLAIKMVIDGQRNFSAHFFKHLAKHYKSNNLVSCPLSIFLDLSMAAYGSKHDTRERLFRVLGFSKKDAEYIKTGYAELMNDFTQHGNGHLSVENNLYHFYTANNPKSKFTDIAKKTFKSTDVTLGYSYKQYEFLKTVEKWIEAQDTNSDKNIVGHTDIGLDPFVLGSSVFFTGTWKTKFDGSVTSPRDFQTIQNKIVSIPTMYAFDHFRHGQLPQVDATFVELPYENENFGMYLILPNDKATGLLNLINNLDKVTNDYLCDNGVKKKVHLYVPKFTIDHTLSIKEILESMGLDQVFSTDSDFTRISDSPTITPRGVGHGAVIQVHEEGTGPVDKDQKESDVVPRTRRFAGEGDHYPDFVEFEANSPFIVKIITRGKYRVDVLTALFAKKH